MSCGGCWMATLRRAAFAASRIASGQTVAVGSGAWVDGVGGNGSSAPAGAADRLLIGCSCGPPLRGEVPLDMQESGCLGERTISLQDGHARAQPAAYRHRRRILLGRPSIPDSGVSGEPSSTTDRGTRSGNQVAVVLGVPGWACVSGAAACRTVDLVKSLIPGRSWLVRPAATDQCLRGRRLWRRPSIVARLGLGGRAASILLDTARPTTDQANPRRIGRRTARRSCRHPENRRPTPGVLAAHGRCQPTLMSATHWQ